MKYIPLNNQPNISRTRFPSISPSLQMDNRSYPHVAWLEEKLSSNEVRYSFWDGLQWAHKDGLAAVYRSEEEIVSSPNSLVLSPDYEPFIAFSRNGANGAILSLASYSDQWDFNELETDYDAEWIGVVRYDRGLEFSSSSTSSAGYSSSSSSSSSSSEGYSSSSSSSSSSSMSNPSSSSSSSSQNISSSSSSESLGNVSSSSSSSSSSSFTGGMWVTRSLGSAGVADFNFYNDSFSLAESESLPANTNSYGADFRYHYYYMADALNIYRYSYDGILLNTYSNNSGLAFIEDIAVDESNNVAYLVNGTSLKKISLVTGNVVASQTTSMSGNGLYFDGTYLYEFGDDFRVAQKFDSDLISLALKIGDRAFFDGYLLDGYWYISRYRGTSGIYNIHKYSIDADGLPDVDQGIVGIISNSTGRFGRTERVESTSSESVGNVSSSSSSQSLSSNSSSSLSSSSSTSSSSSSSVEYSSSSSSSSIDSSSSSSSSSYNDAIYFVVVYDSSNSMFKVYAVTDATWRLIGSKVVGIGVVDSIKIDICGRKIGIAAIHNDTTVKYNFFDVDYEIWSFSSFNIVGTLASYGNIVDMSFAGYNVEDLGMMSFAWLSRSNSYFYVGSITISDEGVEQPTNLTNPIIEFNLINVQTSSNYIVNGYNILDVVVDSFNRPYIMATGASSKLFHYTGVFPRRDDELINIEGVANGIVPTAINMAFNEDNKVCISSDSGDIYYFEPDITATTFPVSSPDMFILNEGSIYRATYRNGSLSGIDIEGLAGNLCGGILRDTERPILITAENYSSSSSSIDSSSSTSSSSSSSSSSSYIGEWYEVGSFGAGYDAIEKLIAYNGDLYATSSNNVPTTGYAALWKLNNATSVWTISNTFSGVNTAESTAVYDSKLFIGLGNDDGDAQLYSYDGSAVTLVLGPITEQGRVVSLGTFDSKIYAGTEIYDGSSGTAQTWLSSNGVGFTLDNDFGAGFVGVHNLLEYDGAIWAGMEMNAAPPKMYYNNGSGWTFSSDLSSGSAHAIRSMAVYNNELYVGTGNQSYLWKFNGSTWTNVYDFVSIGAERVESLKVYKGLLWIGLGRDTGDGYVYTWNGTDMVFDHRFDSANVEQVESFEVYNGKLYAGLGRDSSSAAVWSTFRNE